MESNLTRVGALWENTSEKGNVYYNLALGEEKYVVFRNTNKNNKTHPDFIVYSRTNGSGKTEGGAEAGEAKKEKK